MCLFGKCIWLTIIEWHLIQDNVSKRRRNPRKWILPFMKYFPEMKLIVAFSFSRKPNPVASAILEDKMNNITSLSNLLLGKGAPSKIVKLIQIRKSWPQQQAVPGGFLIFFLRLPPPWWIFYLMSTCHISHMQSKCTVNNTSNTWIDIVNTNHM